MLKTRRLLSLLTGITVVSILFYYFSLTHAHIYAIQAVLWWSEKDDITTLEPNPHPLDDPHPIVALVHDADVAFNDLLKKETHSLASAAWEYRQRRGRHPPPGFDKWHQYAVDNNAVIIEEFWDQIYHDLNPLWALGQKEMFDNVRSQEHIISIRNGKVSSGSNHFWLKIWKEMVGSMAKNLPDLDMAVNHMDEPRLLIPWEEMNSFVEREQEGRRTLPADQVTSKYTGAYQILSLLC
jgi:hypothetical protein